MALQQLRQLVQTERLAGMRLQVIAQARGGPAVTRRRGRRSHAAVAHEDLFEQGQQAAFQRQCVAALEILGQPRHTSRHAAVVGRVQFAEAARQLFAAEQAEQARFFDIEHPVDQPLGFGVPGMRLFRIHQRQGAGRQRVAPPAALVAADAVKDRADGEGRMAVAAERLAGEVRMEQLHAGQPGARQQPVGGHQASPSTAA